VSVHKSGNGWTVRWREGSRNRSRKIDRKADALHFDSEVRRKRQLGGFIPPRTGGITLEDFTVQWLSDKKPNLAPATLSLYGYLIDTHIQPQIGHVPVNEIHVNTLEDWQRERQAKGVGPEALSKAIALLRQILRRAVKAKLLAENPAADLEPPVSKTRIPTPADPEQIEGIRDWFLARKRPADATLVSVLGYAGLRPGEALGLRWADVEKISISIARSISMGQEKETKTGALRVIRPPRQVFQDLATWKLASPAPFGLVWPRRKDGEPWTKSDWNNWRKRYFAKAVEAVGLGDFRPYDLRHSRASMLAAEGKPITEAAYEMGHSPAVFLSTYAHVIEQARDRENVSAEQWIAEARSKRREATG
jgi:integrase